MHRNKAILLLIFLLQFSLKYGLANVNLDSLWKVWNDRSLPDTTRLSALYDISWDGYIYSDPDSTFHLALMMLSLARESQQKKWEAKAYNAMAAASWILGNYKEAINNYNLKLQINRQLKDLEGLASCYNNIGLVYQDMGDYEKAIESHEESLRIKQERQDTNGIAKSYNNLSIIYTRKGNYPRALDLQFQNLALRRSAPNQMETANTYVNIGNIYWRQKNYEEALKYYHLGLDIFQPLNHKKGIAEATINIGGVLFEQNHFSKALEYFETSLQLNKELGNKLGLAMAYFNLGRIELKLENYDTARRLFTQSQSLYSELENKRGLAESLEALGKLHLKKKEYVQAVEHCKAGFELADQIQALLEARDCSGCLYEALKRQKQYRSALFYLEKYTQLNDSLFNESNTKTIAQLEMQFDHEKETYALQQKQKEALLKAEIEKERMKRQSNLQVASVIVISILIIFLLTSLSNRRLKAKNQALSLAQKNTEEKNRELQLYIKSNNQLEDFAHTVSHDLKAPIRSILNFSQLVERELPIHTDPKIKDHLHHIIASSKNMKQLVEDLLTYSKIKSTGIRIVEINPKSLLQVLLYDIQSTISEKEAFIQLNGLPETILGDRTKIKQLLQNLILNAIKFVDPSVKPRVEIDCRETDSEWLFSIRDNGIGIDPKYHQEIFQSFRRLNAAHQYEGSGLGLSVCKKVVEQHKGTIWLQSEPGNGTSFFFTIHKFLN